MAILARDDSQKQDLLYPHLIKQLLRTNFRHEMWKIKHFNPTTTYILLVRLTRNGK